MNAPFGHVKEGWAESDRGCGVRRHPAVLVWPTAAALSWLVVGTIGWIIASLVT